MCVLVSQGTFDNTHTYFFKWKNIKDFPLGWKPDDFRAYFENCAIKLVRMEKINMQLFSIVASFTWSQSDTHQIGLRVTTCVGLPGKNGIFF